MTTPTPGSKRDSIRFDDDVQEQLQEWCKKEHRSKNYAVNYLVRQALFSEWRDARAMARARETREYPDPKVCEGCGTGYYGESCPFCQT